MIRRNFILGMVVVLSILLSTSCNTGPAPADMPTGKISIIPLPNKITEGQGHFILKKNAVISLPNDKPEWALGANHLMSQVEAATGQKLKIGKAENAAITFSIDRKLGNIEGYRISVTGEKIEVVAKKPQGALYAVQTLLQLMPDGIFSDRKSVELPIRIPAVEIEDAPRFRYRGMHLDVGRHFFDVAAVKRFIDLMVMHKYNTFHWHLTEDQGWRIEIKKYPKLTSIGAFRDETLVGHYSDVPIQYDGKKYGGFYTQEEVKEVIAYAQDRFITIIPEIELPGHAQAAIAAYPELGCAKRKLKVKTNWGVSENVFCPTSETFNFLSGVLDEVAALFPGEYFHIGGDECPKKQWEQSAFCQNLMKEEGLKDEFELQSFFIKRIGQLLAEKGKIMIGWDEILEGGLAPNAVVMSWRGIQGGIEAANEGHDVIMSPTTHCYFDYLQSTHPDEPLAIGGYLPLEKAYEFDPIPEALDADKHRHILGGQANVWTEYIPTMEKLEYMVYPRGAATAEVLWSDKSQKSFEGFSRRLADHFGRFEAKGVNAAKSFFDTEGKIRPMDGKVEVALISNVPNAQVTFTLDGSDPKANTMAYASPFEVTKTGKIKAAAFVNGIQQGRPWEGFVNLHKAVGKPITLAEQPAEKYGSGGNGIILNGIYGSESQYSDKEWLGFEGKNFEAVIDLGAETDLVGIRCRFFHANSSWIYLPKKMSVFASTDGKSFLPAGSTTKFSNKGKVASPLVKFNGKARYLKVLVERNGIIGKGLPGEGNEAWLFVGEIVVN